MKKLLSVSIAAFLLAIVLGTFGLTASAAETERFYGYVISNGEAKISNVDLSISGDAVIPDTLGGYPVTSIEVGAFQNCMSLKSIIIPDGVTSIGDYAFYQCISLESITIPDSVTSIGDDAFSFCTSLTSITLPDSVTSIGNYAFRNCTSLESITIPDSVTSIGDVAFQNCTSLTSIALPDSVTSIAPYVFENCTSLESITIPGSVTSIGYGAFKGCTSLKNCTLPDSVTSIEGRAFFNCKNLESITLHDSVVSIDERAFYGCTSLESITVPKSVISIGSYAFGASNVQAIIYCYKSSYAAEYAIANNKYYVYIDGSEEDNTAGGKIGKFKWSVNKKTGVLKLSGTGDVVDFSSVPAPWNEYKRYIASVELPDTITKIGAYAFSNCKWLTSITIPESVTSIGDDAFGNCTSLKSITIPKNVSLVDIGAFSGCSALEKIAVYSKDCEFSSDCGLSYNNIIYGFKGSTAETFADQIGAEFIDIMTIHSHTFDEGVVTKEPTCVEEGETTYTCAECTYAEIKPIAKTGHECEEYKAKAPTCTEIGFDAYETCIRCDYTTYEEIAALGHAAIEHAAKAATCTEKGWAAYETCTRCDYTTYVEKAVLGHKVADGECERCGQAFLKITAQPKTIYSELGEKAKFTVKATGEGLKYQWYYKDVDGAKYKKCSGTKSSYSIEMTEARKDRKFYCIIKDKYGNEVKSKTVYMRMAASIKTQPKTLYVQLGEKAKFTVKAVGDDLEYQWYYKSAGSSKYKKASCTKATYTITMTEDRKDRKFYCVIKDKYGNEVKSKTVTMKLAASIKTEPKSVKTSIGKKASFTVKAVGDGLKYQWYYKDTDGKKYKKASCTKATYSIELTKARNGRKFYCVVTDKYGNTVKSKTVSMKKK